MARSGRSWPLAHLTEVYADAHFGKLGLVVVDLLESQRKSDRGARGLEGEEEAVTGGVHLAPASLDPERSYPFLVMLDQLASTEIAEPRLERRGVHQIGEHQREQARLHSPVALLGHGGKFTPGRLVLVNPPEGSRGSGTPPRTRVGCSGATIRLKATQHPGGRWSGFIENAQLIGRPRQSEERWRGQNSAASRPAFPAISETPPGTGSHQAPRHSGSVAPLRPGSPGRERLDRVCYCLNQEFERRLDEISVVGSA